MELKLGADLNEIARVVYCFFTNDYIKCNIFLQKNLPLHILLYCLQVVLHVNVLMYFMYSWNVAQS